MTNEKKGNLDEQESDPFSFVLYKLICKWALESMHLIMFLYAGGFGLVCYTNGIAWRNQHPLTHWAFIISRGKAGVDSIVFKYDDSKEDNAREKVSPKNIFANPFKPCLLYLFLLSIGLLLLHQQREVYYQ